MNLCSNCGYKVPIGSMICPNCRARLVPNTSWPPEPVNVYFPPVIETEKLIMGRRWGDVLFGFVAYWIIFFLPLLGDTSVVTSVLRMMDLILPPVVYFGARRTFATFARGFGFGILSTVVLFVVGLGVFIYQLMNGDIHFPC